eukprot:PhF_6_TR4580/c0_g1_i1/m.6442/K03671/trxA; thioredoxin 1
MVKQIANVAEYQAALQNEKIVLDFYADWCGPCKMIAPLYAKLAEENKGIEFYKVNVDEAEDVAALCDIQAMPTMKAFFKGANIQTLTGANPTALQDMVKALAAKA